MSAGFRPRAFWLKYRQERFARYIAVKYSKKLRPIEAALLLAVTVTLLAGAWAMPAGGGIAGSLVRLHVIAASDEPAEQALKLAVRDSVIEYLEPRLAGAQSPDEAREIISGSLEGLRRAAESAAGGRTVSAELGEEYYPTRDYGGFALPAGRYRSLRVTIGPGEGQNWWCVIFPPLCLDSAAMEELPASVQELISEPGERQVTFRFRIIELWNELLAWLGAE